MIKKALGLFAISLYSISFANAQVANFTSPPTCTVLTVDMRAYSTDSSTQGQVSTLQRFLLNRGYISVQPTGDYRSLTMLGVLRFQREYGITQNGVVGPLTRAKIKELTCGSISGQSSTIATSTASSTAMSVKLAEPYLSSVSPISQAVIGGSQFGIATFTFRTSQPGQTAILRELRFSQNVTDPFDNISVQGVTASFAGDTATVSGLYIPITSSGVDIPVMVRLSGFQNTISSPGPLTRSISNAAINLTYVEATNANGGVLSTVIGKISSNPMAIVASKPTVSVGTGGTPLVLGAENKIGEFTVTADANGKIALSQVQMMVASVGINSLSVSSVRVLSGGALVALGSGSGSQIVIRFDADYEIPFGQTKTFSVYGTVSGTAQSNIGAYIASSLVREGFIWKDVIGGNTQFTGSVVYNFPTNSFKTAEISSSTTLPSITADELAQGWYYGEANQKKPGTPSTWVHVNAGTRSAMWKAAVTTGRVAVKLANSNVVRNSAGQPMVPLIWSSENADRCILSTDGLYLEPAPLNGSTTVAFYERGRNVSFTCTNSSGGAASTGLWVYGYMFKNTADYVLKMAVKSVPMDLAYDINKDGRVNSADANAYQATTFVPSGLVNADRAYIANRMGANSLPKDLAYDINGDSIVNSEDALAFLRLSPTASPTNPQQPALIPKVTVYKVDLPYLYVSYENLPKSEVDIINSTTGQVAGNYGLTSGGSGSTTIQFLPLASGVSQIPPNGTYYLRVLSMVDGGGEVTKSPVFTIQNILPPPTCSITTNKSSYKYGDTVTVTYSSLNANYAAFVPDTSGKDNLVVGGDKMNISGTQTFTANVLGNPTITLKAVAADGRSSTCVTSFEITPAVKPYPSVSGISASSALPGTSITIYGANFDSSSYVSWGGANGSTHMPTQYSDTSLTFTVPSVPAGKYSVSVNRKADNAVYETSNTISAFTVIPTPVSAAMQASPQAFGYGVYQSSNSSTVTSGSGIRRKTTRLEGTVTVTLPHEANGKVLVLTAYNPINWIIQNPNNVSVTKVIAIGYYAQRVTGLSGVEIESLSYQTGTTYAYAYENAGGDFNNLVSYLAGKGITLTSSNFQGSYSTDQFSSGSTGAVLGAASVCLNLPFNFHRGNESPSTKKLQVFLIERGFLDGEVTGFYGDKTVSAVKDYQLSKGLPQTGMVYDFTRKAIAQDSCQ